MNDAKRGTLSVWSWSSREVVDVIVTDGANINVGHKNGLWALLENERQQELIKIPLMKIWCS